MAPKSPKIVIAGKKPLVYIAEDDALMRELIVLLVNAEDCDCCAFANAEDALVAFNRASIKPQLIISDFSMGLNTMSGLDLLAECKRLCPAIKTFLVSGTVDQKMINLGKKSVDVFLAKPFRTLEFTSMLNLLLGRKGPSVPKNLKFSA